MSDQVSSFGVGVARIADELQRRPFEDLLDPTGLLWLINATVFHPRGYALAIDLDEETGKATGWYLMGDGKERWAFAEDEATAALMERRFRAVQRTLP